MSSPREGREGVVQRGTARSSNLISKATTEDDLESHSLRSEDEETAGSKVHSAEKEKKGLMQREAEEIREDS